MNFEFFCGHVSSVECPEARGEWRVTGIGWVALDSSTLFVNFLAGLIFILFKSIKKYYIVLHEK